MKSKILWLFFLLLFFLAFTQKPVMALGIEFKKFQIPYFQCGNAENPDANKCCGLPIVDIDTTIKDEDIAEIDAPNDQGIIGRIRGKVVDIFTGGAEKATSLLFGLLKKFTDKMQPQPDRVSKFMFKYSLTRKMMCLKGEPQGELYDTDGDPTNDCICVIPAGILAYDDPKEVAGRLCKWISVGRPASQQSAGLREEKECRECISGYEHTINGDKFDTGDRIQDNGADRSTGIWTSLGCVYTDFKSFIEQNLLRWAISIAGFIALLCIAYSAFKMQVSRGNPENIQKARERMTSCILGLLLIIFAVLVLKVIGVNILSLPGFG